MNAEIHQGIGLFTTSRDSNDSKGTSSYEGVRTASTEEHKNIPNKEVTDPISNSGASIDSGGSSGYEDMCDTSAGKQQENPPPEPIPDYPIYGDQDAIPRFPSMTLPYNPRRIGPRMSPPIPSNLEQLPVYNIGGPTYDNNELKQKKCNLKKICKYVLWILIFLGISGIVALFTISQQKTDEVEFLANAFPELLRGQDEEIKNINQTIVNAVKEVNGSVNSIKLKILKLQDPINVTNRSQNEFKEIIKKWFEEFKKNITDNIMISSLGLISDNQLDGRCKNVTVGNCVSNCYQLCNGDFLSCDTCSGYVTCANRVLFKRKCPLALVWDDDRKQCVETSNTCNLLQA